MLQLQRNPVNYPNSLVKVVDKSRNDLGFLIHSTALSPYFNYTLNSWDFKFRDQIYKSQLIYYHPKPRETEL